MSYHSDLLFEDEDFARNEGLAETLTAVTDMHRRMYPSRPVTHQWQSLKLPTHPGQFVGPLQTPGKPDYRGSFLLGGALHGDVQLFAQILLGIGTLGLLLFSASLV